MEDWDQVAQVLKRLSSRAFASNEQFWRQQFCQICYTITEVGDEFIYRESCDEEKFFSQMMGLLTNIICTVGDTLNQEEHLIKKTCRVIIKYCLHHLKKQSKHLMLTPILIVGVLESLCKFQLSLSKDEMLPFQCECVEPPSFLKDVKIQGGSKLSQFGGDLMNMFTEDDMSKVITQSLLTGPSKTKTELRNELKNHNILYLRKENGGQAMIDFALSLESLTTMTQHYTKMCDEEKPLLAIEAENISNLSGELRLLKEILSWSIMEPLMKSKVNELSAIVEMGLKAALFVASGRYVVEKPEVTLPNGTTIPSETYCRKYGWKTTEYALENLEIVGKTFSASPNLSGSVLVNMQVNCVYTILHGLKSILPTDSCENTEVNAHSWKWFEGINIMLVTMTSRVILLLSSLIDETSIETNPVVDPPKDDQSAMHLDLFDTTSAQMRLRALMSSLHLPSLLLDLFLAAYGKGVKLSKLCQKLRHIW